MGHGRAAVAPAVPGQGYPFHLAHQVRAHHHVCQLHARAARDGADVPFLLERDRLDRLGPAGVRAAVANRVGGLSRHGSWLAAAGGRGHSGVPPWADVCASGLGEHTSRRDLENAAPRPAASFVGGMRATTRLQAPSSVFVWSGRVTHGMCFVCAALSKLIYLSGRALTWNVERISHASAYCPRRETVTTPMPI